MKKAPLPENENHRLQALFDYQILDSAAEKEFDDLTQLASEICETPIALISLVDPNRQWFKSKVGIEANETSRDIAFCAHAILQPDVFEVTDALEDERFCDNPLVVDGPKIRFYAGTPLVTPKDLAIGTLCVIDTKPKALTCYQRNALAILGRAVVSQLELRLKIKQLKEANEHTANFLSNISHELRTPLNAIISFSHLLQKDIQHVEVPDKFKQFINHIEHSGKRLLSLINSVLDLRKIETGKMELHLAPTNTREFFQNIHAMLKVMALDKNIKLELHLAEHLPDTLVVDETKLGQIVTNLVSNAISFTDNDKHVDIYVGYQQHQLAIDVVDQGAGIAEEDQKLLFGRFQQVGNNPKRQGSGLGLAISKSLTELMQGQISVVSTVGKGSTFKVSIPVVPGVTEPSFTDAKSSITLSGKVLVIEDNMINQEVAKAMLADYNLIVDIADTGEQGVEMANKNHYDLVLMDIQLPGIDGYETTMRIHNTHPVLPIVALTADAFSTDNQQFADAGFNGFLSKPIEQEKLKQTLNKFLAPQDKVTTSTESDHR